MNTEDDLASAILLLEKIEATLVSLSRLRASRRRQRAAARRSPLSWIIRFAASTAIIIGALCGVAYVFFSLL